MTAANTTRITICAEYAEQVSEMLELCDDFLRNATPVVRAELTRYLARIPGAPDSHLLIDLLGFTALSCRPNSPPPPKPTTSPSHHE